MSDIGLYKNVSFEAIKTGGTIDLLKFLQEIQNGKWQDLVIPIRNIKEHKARQAKKENTLPCVTLSGIFKDRTDAGVISHSGFIAIDIDPKDNPKLEKHLNEIKDKFTRDESVYSCFTSVSGFGLCIIFRIEGNKHREAFLALAFYIREHYGLVADPSGVNESRVRFVSWDPFLYLNEQAKIFKNYLPKEEKKKEFPDPIFIQNDFDQMVATLATYNPCDEYRAWIAIGYALADKFGQAGEKYFHLLSSKSSKYDPDDCTKQYKALLRSLGSGKEKQAKISTIYYYAKKYNVPFYTQQNKKILDQAVQFKKSGISQDDAIKTMEMSGIKPEESKLLAESVYLDSGVVPKEGTVTRLENWFRYNYKFRRNVFTKRIEVDGKEMDDTMFNTVFIAAKKVFDKDIKTELARQIIESSFTPDYHPFLDFFEKYKDHEYKGAIDQWLDSITVTDPVLFKTFFYTWIVGAVASIFGKHSRYVLVFTGEQLSGKTELWRRLLPSELNEYYDESKMDNGKDDEILATQKLIIMDDEFGGRSKREAEQFKNLTSKQKFTIRAPYGRYSQTLNRIANFCGCTNKKNILVDWTGNTRILPVEIIKIDFEKINKVNRIALFMEAFKLYRAGYHWELTQEQAKEISEKTEEFEERSLEYELIDKYFNVPTKKQMKMDWNLASEQDKEGLIRLTATDVKIYIEERERDRQKLNPLNVGRQLVKLGFRFIMERKESGTGSPRQLYRLQVVKSGGNNFGGNNDKPIDQWKPGGNQVF